MSHPTLMQTPGDTANSLHPILHDIREEGQTTDNILWVIRQNLSQIERVISLIRVATPDTP